MKALAILGLLIFTTSAFSAVVKSQDDKAGCTLYRVANSEGNNPIKIGANETIFLNREVYGITFENLEIDFDNREAKLDVVMSVVLGTNRKISETKSIISADNPTFTKLINQLNRKLFFLEKVCISNENKIIYAKEMTN